MDLDGFAGGSLVQALPHHPGYARLFAENTLTVGLILPLETHPDSPAPSMVDHVGMAQKAEDLGFAALWMRDVPFYDPHYGDVGQIFDPLVYIAYLAAATSRIALGTAGVVLPMRHPLILAKQVTSLDQLSSGRMLLGLSSGDRPSEYPLFRIDFGSRGERFREAYEVYRPVSEDSFPHFDSPGFGQGYGRHDLIPKPPFGRTPAIAVGRAQQDLEWIARRMDGFIGSSPDLAGLFDFGAQWRTAVRLACGEGAFKPLGIGGFLDLTPDVEQPLTRTRGGFRSGWKALADFLEQARTAGVSHIALNPKVSRRPYLEVMEELAEHILPRFASH